ncbi:hypothetical protein DL991_10575 [Amycolatopsis sp. WAC 01375]|nr:hypothetical protein DL991_10575 [Amycolatopsis sp. WAC 01375]
MVGGVRTFLATLSALLLVPVLAGTAHAYDKIAEAAPVTMVESPGGEGEVRARLVLGTVTAGTSHNLRSEIEVGDGRVDGAVSAIAIGHKITCQPVGGTTLPNTAAQHGQIWSGQNLLHGGRVTLVVRMLFKPATTGNYECLLRAYVLNGYAAGQPGQPGRETARLYSGFIGDIDGAIGPEGFAQTFGSSQNTFLGMDAPGKQVNPVDYIPLPGATRFLATADLFATSCYGEGGNACPDGTTYPGKANTAMVRFRTVATPSSAAPGCVAQATPSETAAVSGNLHHLRLLGQLTVTQPASGCGTWRINAFVQDNGGTLPFVIHGNPYSVTYARPPV